MSTKLTLNDVARAITRREGGTEQVNIAQVNDVLVAFRDCVRESFEAYMQDEDSDMVVHPADILSVVFDVPVSTDMVSVSFDLRQIGKVEGKDYPPFDNLPF